MARLLTGVAVLLCGALSRAFRRLPGLRPAPREAQWSPTGGDDVEVRSRRTSAAWYPAIVTYCCERGGEWPYITVKFKCDCDHDFTGLHDELCASSSVIDDALESEIRPIRRLAAARRKRDDVCYHACDVDNANHLRSCDGCPACEGLGEYYRRCEGCGRMHHVEDAECLACKSPRTRKHPTRWPPREGDEVEMRSRFVHNWFPAVVTACDVRVGEWPILTVKIKGNGVVDEGMRSWEVRPMRRLAAARRELDGACYHSYDKDNDIHLQTCDGCPECDGLAEYYRYCHCGVRHHCTDKPCPYRAIYDPVRDSF